MATAIPITFKKRRLTFTEKVADNLAVKFNGQVRWVRAYVIRQTEKAWLVIPLTVDGEKQKAVWLPKSTVAKVFKFGGDEFRLLVTAGWVLHKLEIDKVRQPDFGAKLLPVSDVRLDRPGLP